MSRIFLISLLFLFPSSMAYAVTLKQTHAFSIPWDQADQTASDIFVAPYFDSNNVLQFKKIVHAPGFLAKACETKPEALMNSSPTHQIYLADPRVDTQRCPPNASFKIGYDVVVGVGAKDHIQWKYSLSTPDKTGYGKHKIIIGASKDGIIVYSISDKTIEVLSPKTGVLLYSSPYHPTPPHTYTHYDYGLFDAATQKLYVTDTADDSNEPATTLFRIDLATGTRERIATLPRQLLTKIPATVNAMVISKDRKYLIIAAEIYLRFIRDEAMLLILDLKSNEWVYEKEIPAYSEKKLAMAENGDIGLLISCCGKYSFEQLRIEESAPESGL